MLTPSMFQCYQVSPHLKYMLEFWIAILEKASAIIIVQIIMKIAYDSFQKVYIVCYPYDCVIEVIYIYFSLKC